MANPELGKIKGAAFREFLVWWADQFGRSRLEDEAAPVIEAYPDDFDTDRPALGILASNWYQATVVHELVDRLTEDWPAAELDQRAAEAADFIMNRTLRGIYKTMFSMFATPSRYARHVTKLWRQHYDTGAVLVETPEPNVHEITFEGWRSHHAFICRMNMASAAPIYLAMGCEPVSWQRVGCVSLGAERCECLVQWGDRAARAP